MTPLEIWLDNYKKIWDLNDEGLALQAIAVIEELKAALEKYRHCWVNEDGGGYNDEDEDGNTDFHADKALAMDPETLGGPDEFKNKSQAY
jgi:hypothetical protein